MTPEQRRQAAASELAAKSLQEIQRETAITWAYRAWYAHELSRVPPLDPGDDSGVLFFRDATEYAHEAVEHAALCGDDSMIAAVRRIIATGNP